MRRIKWTSLAKIAVMVFVLYLGTMYWPYISSAAGIIVSATLPLVCGAITAYIINIPMGFFERKLFSKAKKKFFLAIKRPVCILLALLSISALISIVLTLVIPEMIEAVRIIAGLVVEKLRDLERIPDIYKLIPQDAFDAIKNTNWENIAKQAIDMVVAGIGGTFTIIFATVSSVFSSIFNIFLAAVFALYLLLGKEKIAKQLERVLDTYFKNDKTHAFYHIIATLNDTFRSFIVGQCSEAVIIGVLCTLGMYIFQFPHAMATGALVGLTALIPVAGAWIGACVGALLILTVSPIKALLFLVYIIILQQLENNLIYPKVVGTSIGLPGIWVLAAITIGGGALGIGGMLISVPIAAAVYRLLREDVTRREALEESSVEQIEMQEVSPEEDKASEKQ